jgi:hypothetical protein
MTAAENGDVIGIIGAGAIAQALAQRTHRRVGLLRSSATEAGPTRSRPCGARA